MRGDKLLDILGGLDAEFICEADVAGKRRRVTKKRILSGVAAVLLLCVTFAVYFALTDNVANNAVKSYIIFTESSMWNPMLLDDTGCSVILGDWRGVRYGKYYYKLTDEQVYEVAIKQLGNSVAEVTDRPAQAGDIIEAELYVTLSDGRKFEFNKPYTETSYPDGSTIASAPNYINFVVGKNNFSGGALESASIGHSVGESVTAEIIIGGNDIDLYGFLNRCGLEREFAEGKLDGTGAKLRIVIKRISVLVEEEYDEAYFLERQRITGLVGPNNLEEHIANVRKNITESFDRQLAYDNNNSMLSAIYDVCTFRIPETYANEEAIKRQLVIKAIADAEGITVSEKEYRELLQKVYKQHRGREYPTKSSIEREYGEENIKWCILQEKVLNFLADTLISYDAGDAGYINSYLK